MVEQFVQADSMSVLFNRDISVEIFPEPFRLQDNVLIRVAYSEYINYIKTLSDDAHIQLGADLSLLKKYASCGNDELYLQYLRDMMFALSKELYFGELCKCPCTWILPNSGTNDLPLSTLLQWFPQCAKYASMYRDYMLSWGYKIPKVLQPQHLDVYRVAIILYACVVSNSSVKFNVTYDV